MEISKESILKKTHYGLNIYAYVLKQYYPKTTVLSLKGRDCGITQNPFNGGKSTLQINVFENKAMHYDTELTDFKGDVFDFASYHFKIINEEELLLKINEVMNLNFEVKKEDELSWLDAPDDTWYAYSSFYRAPIRNVFPTEKVRLHQIFERIATRGVYRQAPGKALLCLGPHGWRHGPRPACQTPQHPLHYVPCKILLPLLLQPECQ